MSNRQSILIALSKHGQSTYDDLEHNTGIARNKLRIAINDAKKAGHVTVGREDVTNQPAYTITAAGKKWVKANMGCDLPEATTPANVHLDHHPESNTGNPDPKEAELKQVRQQLALAEQQRDTHFDAAEDYKSQLDICESANRHWMALAEAHGCDSLEALRTHIETLTSAGGQKNQDDLKKLNEALQSDLNYAQSLVTASTTKIETLQALVEAAGKDVKDIKEAATGYIIKVPGRKPVKRTHPETARQTAIMAAHIHGRADVIAQVLVGTARGKKQVQVEWQEA